MNFKQLVGFLIVFIFANTSFAERDSGKHNFSKGNKKHSQPVAIIAL
jgi:hypothetical protein